MDLLCCGSSAVDRMDALEPLGERLTDSASLPEGGRAHFKIQGRYVTLLRLEGKVYCIDSVCFHAGGPLGVGDIEEVNGRACLVCPWHYYKIDIASGDKYYQQVKFENGKMVEGAWASNGVKQRTHKVKEVDGGIFVVLSREPFRVDSDEYASMPTCGDRVLASAGRQPVRVHSVGGDGKKPSGQVIRAAREAAQAANPGAVAEGSENTSSS